LDLKRQVRAAPDLRRAHQTKTNRSNLIAGAISRLTRGMREAFRRGIGFRTWTRWRV
jgi:hypothetical protein